MAKSPLQHPRLLAIERKLDVGALEDAQHLLAALGDERTFGHAIAYLSTRLLYQRGHLDERGVVERLEQLLEEVDDFPEALTMLEAARAGVLDRSGGGFKTSRPPPPVIDRPRSSRPPPEPALPPVSASEIPKAARLPDVRIEPRPRLGSIPDLTPPTPPVPPSQPDAASEDAIVSAAPPPVERSRPSLFEVAAMLDEERFDEALAALAERGPSDDPEQVLMEARVLDRAGKPQAALELVRRLGHAPLLESDVRATVARLALELGDVEFALAQAVRAERDDPLHPMVRLSLAWAALRKARRSAELNWVARAKNALADLQGVGGVYQGVLSALAACIEAHSGDAARALALSSHALEIDKTPDALAARAMALARLGRASEAVEAAAELRRESPDEARALQAALDEFGDALFGGVDANAPVAPNADANAIWGPLELAVVEQRASEAWRTFRQLSLDTFAQLSATAVTEPPALAAVVAGFLTVAPVSRDFAPYDETLWSLHRLEATFDALAPGSDHSLEPEHPLVLMLGAYVGEVLRQSLDGRWRAAERGAPGESAEVVSKKGKWNPYRMVRERLRGQGAFGVSELLELSAGRARKIGAHAPAVAPPCPWDPAPWPAPAKLPSYARALTHSVIALYCAKKSGLDLNGSVSSVRALDAYLELIAPAAAPPSSDPGLLRRPAVLSGAYLGEVLRSACGARWSVDSRGELGPESYTLRLPTAEVVEPVSFALSRLSTGRGSLLDYATAAIDRAG